MRSTSPAASRQRSLSLRWSRLAIPVVALIVVVARGGGVSTTGVTAFGGLAVSAPRLHHRPAGGLLLNGVAGGEYSVKEDFDVDADTTSAQGAANNRRDFLTAAAATSAAAVLQLAAPQAAAAAADGADNANNNVTPKEMLARMRSIPTFTLVDGTTGVPYMIYDKQGGGATEYFFTSFKGAAFVLDEAKADAAKNDYVEVWENAKVVTVPLDIALRLALKKMKRKGQKEMVLDTIGDVIASAEAIEAALKIDTTQRYKTQGSVPLFYIDGLTLSPDENGATRAPVYLSKADLVSEWNTQNPGSPAPEIKVVDLIETFRAVMKPSGTPGAPSGTKQEFLNSLVFVPISGTVKVAKELKAQENVPQYNMNEMMAVGGK